MRVANLLVGNDEDTAGVEITFGACSSSFKMSDSLPGAAANSMFTLDRSPSRLATLVLLRPGEE